MRNWMRRVIVFFLAFTVAVTFAACAGGQQGERPQPKVEINLPFKDTVRANGAGASFPAPLYQSWFRNLNTKEPQLQFNFQSTGSGTGIERFTQGVVDFAASDIAMTDEQITKVNRGVLMLPMTAGSIVLAYNLGTCGEINYQSF
jgi:phosphate transport system substrate-binding protein